MHSVLRKELRDTPKILQSVRTRALTYHIPRRTFSHRARLLNQPGSKDSTSSVSSGQPAPTEESKSVSKSSATQTGASDLNFTEDVEKWIQFLSDNGEPLNSWAEISEVDQNGKRRLLPHVKKEFIEAGKAHGWDQKSRKSFSLVIDNGRVRFILPQGATTRKDNQTEKAEESTETGRGVKTAQASQTITSDQQKSKDEESGSRSNTQMVKNEVKAVSTQLLESGNLIPKFHGSPAARRLRPQARWREQTQVITLPDWFSDGNVLIKPKHHIEDATALDEEHRSKSSDFALPETEKNMGLSDEDLSNLKRALLLTDGKLRLVYDVFRRYGAPSHKLIAFSREAVKVLKDLQSSETPKIEENNTTDKIQTFAAGSGDGKPKGSDQGANTSRSKNPTSGQHMLVSFPKRENRYYIHNRQREELISTASGRLRLPTAKPSSNSGLRSHMLVHYLANDGDVFLDKLMEEVASDLQCNMITLDVQDIVALIKKVDLDPMIAEEAEHMSYDIYSEIYKDGTEEVEEQSGQAAGEMDEADEEGGPGGPQGMPFIVGKPITIDLKALFGQTRSRRNSNPFAIHSQRLTEMIPRSVAPKSTQNTFQPLIDSILSSPAHKRKLANTEVMAEGPEASSIVTRVIEPTNERTIVHIKDLKAIQERSVGKQFLYELYDQVKQRRASGESIMLVGTSCERSNTTTLEADYIRDMQVSELDEISSTIVITPAYPSVPTTTKVETELEVREELQRTIIPKQDREARIRSINARHLFEMLQSKEIPLYGLKSGFWTKDFTKDIGTRDPEYLAKSFWSFPYIQRLAAIMAAPETEEHRTIEDAVKIVEESDKLKFDWANQGKPEKPRAARADKDHAKAIHERQIGGHGVFQSGISQDRLSQIRAKATKYEKKLLGGVIEPKKISTTFQDIHIPPDTVEALQTLTTLSLVRPDAFKYGVLASDRIPGLLLYGPPGTGKTLAAKAVARESGATMLEVSAADINDMYVGEGEKNVKALFSLAKKLSPCVVFLDEADAMFSTRGQVRQRVSHRELLNQFLKEWDGMSNDSGSAFIMVATNRPMDLDDAVLRRLPRRLLVDLPTENDRQEILKIHLRHETLAEDVDLAKLASRTQFYSGSDLKNVAVAAALTCVREENQMAKQHKGDEPYQYPEKRVLTSAHFDRALGEISASISEDMSSLRDIKKFDEQYGDRKGRRKRSAKWGFKTSTEADAALDTVKVRP